MLCCKFGRALAAAFLVLDNRHYINVTSHDRTDVQTDFDIEIASDNFICGSGIVRVLNPDGTYQDHHYSQRCGNIIRVLKVGNNILVVGTALQPF